jgi:hypothetical protein
MPRLPRVPVDALLIGALLFGGAFWLGQTVVRLAGGTTPPLPQLAPADPQSAAGITAQAHWFGDASIAAPVAAPPLTVIGVLSGPASQAFAIVVENGQKLPLLVGKSTPGGWTLITVTPTGVVLSRAGSSDKVEVPLLSRDAAAPAAPPAAPGGFVPPGGNPANGMPPPQEATQAPSANPAFSAPPTIPSPDNNPSSSH